MTSFPHLDDDQLSALVDGEAEPAEIDHVDGCEECGARLALWRAGIGMVGEAPELPPASQIDAAVAAALAASAITVGDKEADGASVPDMGAPIPIGSGRRRRRPLIGGRIAGRAVAAVAAVILVASVAVTVSDREGGKAANQSTAAGAVATKNASHAGAAVGNVSGSTGAASGSTSGGAAAGSTSGGAAAGSTTAGSSGSSSRAVAVPGPNSAFPGGVGAVPPLGSFPDAAALVGALPPAMNALAKGTAQTGAPDAFGAAFSSCLAPARTAAKVAAGIEPVFEGTLTYEGSPAQVFVFVASGHHVAAVTRVPGCASLADVTF